MCQIQCPVELYTATGLHRSDEKATLGSDCLSSTAHLEPSGGHMTRMMDCAKPSYGWAYNVKYPTFPNFDAVVPCRRDGYTRINAQPARPTSQPTPNPTSPPTSYSPTLLPIISPTATPTFTHSGAPSVPPTFSPTYLYPPTRAPTSLPTSYNASLVSHGLPTFMLDSTIRVDRVFYSSTVLFDTPSQLALCTSIDLVIGLSLGSTIFLEVPHPPMHSLLAEKFEEHHHHIEQSPQALTGYHSLIVKVRSNVRNLPPRYLSFFNDEKLVITAVGYEILSSVPSQRLTHILRSQANLLKAKSLLFANVSNVNVTFVPPNPADITAGMLLEPVEKSVTKYVSVFILIAVIGALIIMVIITTYIRHVENKSGSTAQYTITSNISSDNLLEDGKIRQTPFEISSPYSDHGEIKTPVTERIPSATSSSLHSNSNKNKRQIVHVPAQLYGDEGEIIMFYDEDKGSVPMRK